MLRRKWWLDLPQKGLAENVERKNVIKLITWVVSSTTVSCQISTNISNCSIYNPPLENADGAWTTLLTDRTRNDADQHFANIVPFKVFPRIQLKPKTNFLVSKIWDIPSYINTITLLKEFIKTFSLSLHFFKVSMQIRIEPEKWFSIQITFRAS